MIFSAEWTREAIAEGGLGHNVIDWDQFVREHAERVVLGGLRFDLGGREVREELAERGVVFGRVEQAVVGHRDLAGGEGKASV